jgi:hypothetical protein
MNTVVNTDCSCWSIFVFSETYRLFMFYRCDKYILLWKSMHSHWNGTNKKEMTDFWIEVIKPRYQEVIVFLVAVRNLGKWREYYSNRKVGNTNIYKRERRSSKKREETSLFISLLLLCFVCCGVVCCVLCCVVCVVCVCVCWKNGYRLSRRYTVVGCLHKVYSIIKWSFVLSKE